MSNSSSNETPQGYSAGYKFLYDVFSLLFFAALVLSLLFLYSRSGYEVEEKAETKGWGEGKAYVSVHITDKLTDGQLCSSYESEVFDKSGNHDPSKPVREVFSWEEGQDPKMSEANYAKLKVRAMDMYKKRSIANILLFSAFTLIFYFLRKQCKKRIYR